MNCPICETKRIQVIFTQQSSPAATTRRRKCRECGHQWWTIETAKFNEEYQQAYKGKKKG